MGCIITANTGVSTCDEIADVSKLPFLQAIKDGSGNYNEILCTDTTDQDYWTALINHADPLKRAYPLVPTDNLVDERGDDVVETTDSGAEYRVQQGQRTRTMDLYDMGAVYLGNLEDFRKIKFGLYDGTKSRQLLGKGVTNGSGVEVLRPIAVNNRSWSPKLIKGTETTVQKITVTMQYDSLEQDKEIRVIAAESFPDFDLLELRGLLSVNGVASDISTTNFTLTLTEDYGAYCDLNSADGWIAADFVVYNETTELAVVPSGVVETPVNSGIYVFTMAAQTPADILTVTDDKDGFELQPVTVLIP